MNELELKYHDTVLDLNEKGLLYIAEDHLRQRRSGIEEGTTIEPHSENLEVYCYIAIEEMKRKAGLLGGDAVIFMQQSFSFNGANFYVHTSGTVVRLIR